MKTTNTAILAFLLVGLMIWGAGFYYSHQRISTIEMQLACPTLDKPCSIAQDSLDQVRKILKENNSAASRDDLLKALEDERQIFLGIVALITLLTTFSGLLAIVKSFLTRDEREAMSKMLDEMKEEFRNTKMDTIALEIEQSILGLQRTEPIVYQGEVVNSKEAFLISVFDHLSEIFNGLKKIEKTKEFISEQSLSLFNLVLWWVKRARSDNYIDNNEWNVATNVVFAEVIRQMRRILSAEDFHQLRMKFNEYAEGLLRAPIRWER